MEVNLFGPGSIAACTNMSSLQPSALMTGSGGAPTDQ